MSFRLTPIAAATSHYRSTVLASTRLALSHLKAIGADTTTLPMTTRGELKIGPMAKPLGEGGSSVAYAVPGHRDRVALLFNPQKFELFDRLPRERLVAAAGRTYQRVVEHLWRCRGLMFEGRPPRELICAQNRKNVIGYTVDRVPGVNLAMAIRNNAVSAAQLAEVYRQLKGQLKVMHANGLAHGEPTPRNVMVTGLSRHPPNQIKARFIDFDPIYNRNPFARDRRILDLSFEK